MVARHFLFIFFLSSVNSISKLDWLFQSFKCKDFLVMSIFSLKFASALGIARQCLVNGMIDKYIYIFFENGLLTNQFLLIFLADLWPLALKLILYLPKNLHILVEINIYGNKIISG